MRYVSEFPSEVLAPFESLLEFVSEQDRLIAIYSSSLKATEGLGELASALKLAHRPGYGADSIASAKKFEDDCKSEIERGFPLLVSHSVVALWASLEASVPEFVRRMLVQYPSLSSGDVFSKLKIPPSVALLGSSEDVSVYIIEELNRAVRLQAMWGPSRLDALVASLGIRSDVSKDNKRDLIELSQARNLIAHKAGIIDAKFLAACPWVSGEVGAQFAVGLDDYGRYRSAVLSYAAEVIKSATTVENVKRYER